MPLNEELNRRARRFRKGVEAINAEQIAEEKAKLLLRACKVLAPAFDLNKEEVSRIWADCRQHEEDPHEAFMTQLEYFGMGCVGVCVPPLTGKKGRPPRDKLRDIITDPRETRVWKTFVEKLREIKEPVIIVFIPAHCRSVWLMTNRETPRELKPFLGRILIPIGGDVPNVHVIPLKDYMEEH